MLPLQCLQIIEAYVCHDVNASSSSKINKYRVKVKLAAAMLDPNDVSSLLELTRNIRNVKVPFHLCHTSLDNRVCLLCTQRNW